MFLNLYLHVCLVLLCLALMYFTDTVFCLFIFTNWRFVATLLSKSVSAILPTAFAQFTSQSCFGNSTVFQTFSLFLCVLWCSVISDHWYSTIVIVLGSHKLPRKMTNLINKWCVLTAPLFGHSPIFIPLLRPPCSFGQLGLINATELGQLVPLQQPSRVQVLIKGRVHFKLIAEND